MDRTTNALLICALFLCGLEETVLSQHGHCVGQQCFALLQKSQDFRSAQKICKDVKGQLFQFNLGDSATIWTNLLSASFWPKRHETGTPKEEPTGSDNCSYISVSRDGEFSVLSQPCLLNRNGFLCQFTTEKPCSELQAGDAQVKYVAMDVEFNASETFPSGTIAVAKKPGAGYPDAKHICGWGTWMKAPWNCEVFKGGCEHSCNSTQTCVCPAGQALHPNNISCSPSASPPDPCARCAQECQQEGDSHVCKCRKGYRLARDGRSCEDVDECEEESPCTDEGQECENTKGSYTCRCKDGFFEEEGVCVDVSICISCEHDCNKVRGVYQCTCQKGYKVSATDPTKCEQFCEKRSCKARCIKTRDKKRPDMMDCFCPAGYIKDVDNTTNICIDIDECDSEKPCDHKCENLFGSYKCSCDKGFKLIKDSKCIKEDVDRSGTTPPYPMPASAQPAAVPSYIKTGSVLGITVFLVLCVVLVIFLVQNTVKRCGKFELSSLKHQNIDIFYLQQVTTETYKKLSCDKPFKNDSQIL
ncbi:thrombomodulin-like [Symphorus nematophorus]